MLKKQIDRLVNHYGYWRLTHIVLTAGVITMASIFVLELTISVRSEHDLPAGNPHLTGMSTDDLSDIIRPERTDFQSFSKMIRPGLFKAATPLRDNPMANRTIESIKSRLKLHSILPIKGKLVAYIDIKNIGFRQCEVGDSVEDLFTVLSISEDKVEISIVEHKVTLTF